MTSIVTRDEILSAIFEDAAFERLVAVWGLNEVRIALTDFSTHLNSQLTGGVDSDDPDWRRRAGRLRGRIDSRLSVVKSRIKDENRAMSRSVEALEAKWSDFAEELAEVLEGLDPAALLSVRGPRDSGNAADWLAARRRRWELKEQKEAVA